jgi:hypothetical protein
MIPDLQGLLRQALIRQGGGSAPFHRPALRDAFRIWRLDVDEGMRVAKYKLHDLALDLDFRLAVVCRTKGVMSGGSPTAGQCCDNEDKNYSVFHRYSLPTVSE